MNQAQATSYVALAGNPNCGKTTLFNALTGLRYKVANYPGVTVEKKTGRLCLPNYHNVTLVDLPGIYSLTGTSLDERIATQYLTGELSNEPIPDLIVAIIDASNIERNLYLVTQLIDCGIPVVLALNMSDMAERSGIRIYEEILSRLLDVPVISIVAKKRIGLEHLQHEILSGLQKRGTSSKRFAWLPADSLFREKALALGTAYSESLQGGCLHAPELIGAGILSDAIPLHDSRMQGEVDAARKALTEQGIDPLSYEATTRYRWIEEVIQKSCVFTASKARAFSTRLDSILTHRFWGSIIFVLIMGLIFQSIFMWSQIPMDFIDSTINDFGGWISSLLPDGQVKSLVVDGIIAGVGSVLVFIPQIAILFFFLGLLEDSGYLSRAAFLMDNLMRRVGLQGRSFIPLLSSFACAIPGIMSTRTIPAWADRLATILVAPLMSCSARLPVYAVLIAACIPNAYIFGFISLQGATLLAMYLLGILGAAAVAWVLKKTILKRELAFFVMEMPPFRAPSLTLVLRDVYDRVLTFVKSAGTVILACSVILWFLASYPRVEESLGGNPLMQSYAGKLGHFIEPAIRPLGFNWEIGIGILASFAAREVFVASLATIYNVGDASDTSRSLIEVLQSKRTEGLFTISTALSLMVFYVFACQCMSTLAVCKRETGTWKWPIFMFIYMTALAYVASFVVYRIAEYTL